MTQEKWQHGLYTMTQKVFTKRNGKIALSVLVVCALAAGGGSWYMHQQHKARKEQKVEAVSQMVKAQAGQQNITLITEDQAREAAAAAVGKDPSSLTFDQVALVDMNQKQHRDKHEKNDKKHQGPREDGQHEPMRERPDRNEGPQNMAPAAPAAPAPAGQDNPAGPVQAAGPAPVPQPQQRHFQPMYAIRATDGSVHYKILLDAATGTVIDSRVD